MTVSADVEVTRRRGSTPRLRSGPTSTRAVVAARWLLALALGVFAACRPPPHPPTPCSLRPPSDAPIAAATWLDLLAPGSRTNHAPESGWELCTGEAAATGEHQRPARVLPERRRGPEDLSVAELGDELAVWVRLVDLDDGDAIGPLALLGRHDAHLELHALGALRAPAGAPTIEATPPGGGPRLVVIRGARCPDGGAPCVREAQLLLVAGGRVVDPPLREGGSLGPARMVLADAIDRPIDGARIERATLRRSVELAGSEAHVFETLTLVECPEGATDDAGACEDVMTIRAERTIAAIDGALVVEAPRWREDPRLAGLGER